MYKPKLGYTTVTWAESGAEDWLEQGVRDIASLGFKAFESFATTAMAYDAGSGKFSKLIEEYGMHLVCLDAWADYHIPAKRDEIIAQHTEMIAFIQAHGGDILLTVPTHPEGDVRWGDEEFKVAADVLNEIGRISLDHGVKNSLHPHWGTYVETKEEIEHILDATDPRYVFFAPDCGQIAKGDTDPVAMVRKYVDRVAHVHLKDVADNWPELRNMGYSLAMPEGYASLGQGTVDIRGFIEVLAEANFSGYMLGELDKDPDPKAAAAVSKRFLIEEMGFSI